MAKSFLIDQEIAEGLQGFQASGLWYSGSENEGIDFSQWIESRLLNRFSQNPEWSELGVVALGSWARHELCPRSDIDLLLFGDESKVLSFVTRVASEGVKIRYRIPQDLNDWTVGVEDFDILGILPARAITPHLNGELEEQKSMIYKKGERFLKSLIKAMGKERQTRHQRYDSISNYLEPNLKYGPGGLRDLQQALYVKNLFPHRFEDEEGELATRSLAQYCQFFLTLRRRLHLMGYGDSVTSGIQTELASWYLSPDLKTFMRDIQLGLGRVSFYADWVVERATASRGRLEKIKSQSLNKLSDCFAALAEDSSRLMQGRVRAKMESSDYKEVSGTLIGRQLSRFFHIEQSEQYLVALFKAKVIDFCIPELQRVAGLVQHDQYHRYTVDAHLLQAIRVVKRLFIRPRLVGCLSTLVQQMTPKDWKILLWTALYHDLAKGLGGDHSTKGAALVKRDFIRMKLPLRLTVETAWMVERHLDISTAAFRMNPHAYSTWQKMHNKGISGDRLRRLTVFTAVDILATNPEAWSQWKEKLLMDFYTGMSSPRAGKFVGLMEMAEQARVSLNLRFVNALDPAIPENIPNKILLSDIEALERSSNRDLDLLIWRPASGQFWIRFHSRQDRSGLFLGWTKTLFASGCKILQALVQTDDEFGAYDWFLVKSSRPSTQLKTWISLTNLEKVKVPNVKFERVKLISQDDKEAVISFRGRDRPGLLMVAAQAIAAEGCSIRWAKAFTWGRQVDDVFGIQLTDDLETKVEKIAQRIT